MESFEHILKNLGVEMRIPLAPDKHGNCLLVFPDGTQVQIEPDRSGEKILIVTMLGKLPAGAFRASVLQNALMANAHEPPLHGILAYSELKDSMVLFEYLSSTVSSRILKEHIDAFSEKARTWAEAIASGVVPPSLVDAHSKTSTGRLFGL